jgi:hypothetical protein
MMMGTLFRGERERVLDGGVIEGEGEGRALEPRLELVEEVGAGGVAGFAGGEVGVGVIGVGEVGGKALAGTEVKASGFHSGGVTTVGLAAGAGGYAEQGGNGGVAA